MRIGYNYFVNLKTYKSNVWYQEYFVAEETARKYIENALNEIGAVYAELWQIGEKRKYLTEQFKQDRKEAEAKHKAYIESLCKATGCTVEHL